MNTPQVPHLQLLSRTRLLPECRSTKEARTAPLSILDNTVVRWALTSAVWFYDKPAKTPEALSPDLLTRSLQKTLNSYPQWAGQLKWIPYDPSRGQRHGRVCISYGSATDPGVELIIAHSSRALSSLVPDSQSRIEDGVWCADGSPRADLSCPTNLALHNTDEYAGQPCVSIQLTTFACGGMSIGVKIVHPVADATALNHFVRDWAAINRALLNGQPAPVLSPVFDPALLSKAAAGDVDSPAPDPDLLRLSQSLPMRKHDWWISAPGCPPPMLPATQVPAELQGTDLGPPGEPMPWAEWDVSAPVSHCILTFTPAEVRRIWEAASADVRVSRLDALIAFVWRLIIRARGLEHDHDLVHLFTTISVRSRVSPPLPDTFLGSPIVLACTSLAAEEVAASIAPVAGAIRRTVSQFTPDAVGAYLHDVAHEVNPQRFWRAFLGRRHSIVTSWLGLDPYGVDFGGDAPPRYVDAVMPILDGCIHVMEAGPASNTAGDNGSGRWHDEPVSVSLYLARDVVQRLLKDPELWKYRNS